MLGTEFTLPDGYKMIWVGDSHDPVAKRPYSFRFQLLDAQGKAPTDMAFYMGMLGHAAFLKTDGSVFAHIHPIGSVSMAAFMIAQDQNTKASSGQPVKSGAPADAMDDMPGMHHMSAVSNLPNEVSFPYGLPTPGRFRIFVQMKHGETVETGVFDAEVN